MGSDSTAQNSNRPYPPVTSVVGVLQRVRSRNLPERIDLDYLRDAGISESLVHRVAFALRFLDLVEGDSPSSALREIATSTDEEYQEILGSLIRSAYQEVFQVVDPQHDTQDRIVNVFRRYTPASQRERMVAFFLGMCREAGIPTLDVPRQRTAGSSPLPKASRPKASGAVSTRTPKERRKTDQSSNDQSRRTSEIPPAIELLMRSLPNVGSPMSGSKRTQWLEMAKATLNFLYPDEVEGTSEDDDEANMR